MKLLKHLVEVAEELARLMWILAVAQMARAVDGNAEVAVALGVEIVEDGAVVCARNAEGLLREEAAVGERGHCVAVLLQNLAERRVLMLRSHDHNVVVVLGGGADKRDAAYVDFLYDVGF